MAYTATANQPGRGVRDASLSNSKAFPAAAANNSSTGINTGAVRSGPNGIFPEESAILIEWPALANLVDAKTITFTVQDSADNSSFTSIGLTYVITGGGGVGVAAGFKKFRLPADVRQYVNVNAAVLTAGGDNTASSYTVSIVT